VIAAATIGLCYLTQAVAKLFGIELPDQQNIDIVRQWGLHCFDSWRHFRVFAILCVQVLVVMPALEEFVFRWLLFRLPGRLLDKRTGGARETRARLMSLTSLTSLGSKLSALLALGSSALFAAAHYLAQPWPDAAFVALFFFGLAQCWLYRKTDRLWCAMLNHALFNLTNLVLLFVIPQS